jgi:ribosomal protein S1
VDGMYFWMFFLQNEHLEVGSELDCVILDIDMSTGIVDVSLHPELSAELKDQVISYHKI